MKTPDTYEYLIGFWRHNLWLRSPVSCLPCLVSRLLSPLSCLLSPVLLCSAALGQSALEIYKLDQSVVAAGGGISSAGIYSLEGSAGQSAAGGPSQGGLHSVYSGFFAPLSTLGIATFSIGGRAVTLDGRGIKNVHITLTGPNGETQSSLTGALGLYHFSGLTIGDTYTLKVSSSQFTFTDPTMTLTLNDDLDNLEFVAREQ